MKLLERPGLKFILFSLLALILATGLFFAGYKLGQRQVQPDIVKKPTPMAEWKAYVNATFGYTLKYPPDWWLVEAKPKTFAAITNYNPDVRSSPEFLPGDIKLEVYSDSPEFISLPQEHESQELIFAGQKAVQVVEDQTALSLRNIHDLTRIQRIYIDYRGVRYGIAIYIAKPLPDQEKKLKFILDTFRFLP